jgi:hypothetical protein
LVLLRVSGEIEESAGLTAFGTQNKQRFFSMLPVTFEYGFNNTGGDRVVPRGEIIIKNTLQMTSATFLANENEGSILPDSTRRFKIVWGEEQSEAESVGFFEAALFQLQNFRFGRYSADIQLTWGDSAQTANAAFGFFIIPWQLLTITFLFLGLILFTFKIWMARFKRSILAKVATTTKDE